MSRAKCLHKAEKTRFSLFDYAFEENDTKTLEPSDCADTCLSTADADELLSFVELSDLEAISSSEILSLSSTWRSLLNDSLS